MLGAPVARVAPMRARSPPAAVLVAATSLLAVAGPQSLLPLHPGTGPRLVPGLLPVWPTCFGLQVQRAGSKLRGGAVKSPRKRIVAKPKRWEPLGDGLASLLPKAELVALVLDATTPEAEVIGAVKELSSLRKMLLDNEEDTDLLRLIANALAARGLGEEVERLSRYIHKHMDMANPRVYSLMPGMLELMLRLGRYPDMIDHAWAVMAHLKQDEVDRALAVFRAMPDYVVFPNEATYQSLLLALLDAGRRAEALELIDDFDYESLFSQPFITHYKKGLVLDLHEQPAEVASLITQRAITRLAKGKEEVGENVDHLLIVTGRESHSAAESKPQRPVIEALLREILPPGTDVQYRLHVEGNRAGRGGAIHVSLSGILPPRRQRRRGSRASPGKAGRGTGGRSASVEPP